MFRHLNLLVAGYMKKHIEKLALFVALIAIVAFSWLKPLDATAERQVDEGFKRAVASFAVARILNGTISVAQGTEISLAPGGLGVNLTPGQILDPVNDLVEQFSELMLIASVAFGIMKILLSIGSFWVFSAILSGVAMAWMGFKLTGRIPPTLLTKFLLVLIFVRFSIPIVTVGGDAIFKQFLEEKFKASQIAIEGSEKQLSSLKPPTEAQPATLVPQTAVAPPATVAVPAQPTAQPVQNNGWLDRVRGTFASTVASASQTVTAIPRVIGEKMGQYDPRPYIESLKEQAALLVNHIINLIVVFVLQTIVIPLALMWVLYRSCLALVHSVEQKPLSMSSN